MEQEPPIVIMFMGPNGAGKTTTATALFQELLANVVYVNADVIAQGLSGSDPESVALEAGTIMLERLRELASKRSRIGFETTGASRTFAKWLESLKSEGYRVFVFYFWLPSAEMAIARVAERVKGGGHHVPDETIRRRYDAGLKNFFELYRPIATKWEMIDNSLMGRPRRVAQGADDSVTRIDDAMLWNQLTKRYAK